MTDEEEFAARSQLEWAREGDAWILLYRRRRNGPSGPDKDHSGMWRSVKVDGILSDMANLSWSKDNVMAQAVREVFYDAANTPSKMPSKQGVFSEEIVTHWFKDDRCIAMKGNRQRRLYDVKTAGTNTRINNSNHPWADLDAHSDFQTDQVATYDHSHVWSAQEVIRSVSFC